MNEKNNIEKERYLVVTVYAPSEVEPKEFTWEKTTKVGDAADEAARAFGITTEKPSFQNSENEVLSRNKPLVAEKVKTGDVLELVSAGGGV